MDMILGNLSSRIKQRENLDLGQVPSSKFSSILSIKIVYIYIYTTNSENDSPGGYATVLLYSNNC